MQDIRRNENNDHLVQSSDPEHPANLIPELCRKFYNLGWVTGTGGGVSGFIRFALSSMGRPRLIMENFLTDFHSAWWTHLHRAVRRPEGVDPTSQSLCPLLPYP